MTVDQYIQQYDLVFETGLKISKWGSDDFGNGENMDGLVWYESPMGAQVALQRELSRNLAPPFEKLRVYRSLEIKRPSSLSHPEFPGQTNIMEQITLQQIEGSEPRLIISNTKWPYEDDFSTTDPVTRQATPKELFSFAHRMTETYNWAISNKKLI